MAEGEMVGWHHRCDGHEFEQALGVGDGDGSMAQIPINQETQKTYEA